MNNIWQIAGAIIASVGGAGAIIGGLSSYLGKLWADRMLQNKSQEFERELETYKKDLSLEIEKYKLEAEKLTYVSRIQFETEYNIYKNIFESLYDFEAASTNLFPRLDSVPADLEKRKEEYIQRYKYYCDSFNTYSKVVEINAPFIPKDIYSKFIKIRKDAHGIACMFPEIRIQADTRFAEDYAKIARENFKNTSQFIEEVSQLKIDVRDYLAKLKVSESEMSKFIALK